MKIKSVNTYNKRQENKREYKKRQNELEFDVRRAEKRKEEVIINVITTGTSNDSYFIVLPPLLDQS